MEKLCSLLPDPGYATGKE